MARYVWFVLFLPFCACMGGGGEQEGRQQSQLVILPAPEASMQANGLAYADAGQTLTDAEGTEIAAIAANISDGAGATRETINVTLSDGFIAAAPNQRGAVAAFLDETLVFEDGMAELANGQTVRLFFDDEGAGTFVGIAQLATYAALENPAPANALDAESHIVFGFLADPRGMDGRISGRVVYRGDVSGNGFVRVNEVEIDAPLGTALDGSLALTVDLADDWISGAFAGQYVIGATEVDVQLDMAPTAFTGNTFAGALGCGDGCTSQAQLDAGFYGPVGEEIGGVLTVETTDVIGGDTYQFTGAGSFVATPEAP